MTSKGAYPSGDEQKKMKRRTVKQKSAQDNGQLYIHKDESATAYDVFVSCAACTLWLCGI